MISNCWTWPTVSMCFHSASPVHIAALVPQCICLHLCFFLCLYFCVSASGSDYLVASVSLVCLTIVSYHCLSFCLSFYLFAYISDSPSFYLSFCLSICLSENLIENELTDWLKWRSRNSKFTGGPWLRGSKSSGIASKGPWLEIKLVRMLSVLTELVRSGWRGGHVREVVAEEEVMFTKFWTGLVFCPFESTRCVLVLFFRMNCSSLLVGRP